MRKWLPLVLIGADVAFTLAMYSQLPDRIPTHFGPGGPNGYSNKAVGAWVIPALALGVWLLMRWLPSIDPRRDNYGAFRWAYDSVVFGVVVVLVVVHATLLTNAISPPAPVNQVIGVMIGLLIVLIGSVLPYARSTWFFGIRTPWTLSSDAVWKRTHAFARTPMMLAGIVVMFSGFTRSPTVVAIIIAAAGVLVLIPVVYSYFEWKKETTKI